MRRANRTRLGQLLGVSLILVIYPSAAIAQNSDSKPAKPVAAAKKAPIYDKGADARAQVEKAVIEARRENKRILLMFGFESCGWCHKLHELFASDDAVRKILSYEYVRVLVDIESPNAAELLEKCKAALTKDELKKGVGFPFLGVLDADGKVVTAQRTDSLEVGDHHDSGRVKEFLDRWAVPPKDAELVLRDALSRAGSEDKRLFLTFGAPWCGWCHRLEGWLAQPEIAAIFNQDFVTVKIEIDRMTHGKDVMAKFRPDPSGGIPWFAVLDAHGKALGTADSPKGNIGYPFAPEEINAFMTLIAGNTRRADAVQHERLRKSLIEAADRIKKEQEARKSAAQPVAAR